jgi:hypothetical protein
MNVYGREKETESKADGPESKGEKAESKPARRKGKNEETEWRSGA